MRAVFYIYKLLECLSVLKEVFYRIVSMWNALPRQLRDADSIYSFKRKLVMHYDNLLTDFETDNVGPMYLVMVM